MSRFGLGAIALIAMTALGASRARMQGEMEVPVATQIPLLMKVLTFDRQLRSRAPDQRVVLGVAYQGGNSVSSRVKDEVIRLLAGDRERINGIPVAAVAIDLDRESLGDALRGRQVTALYVAPLRGANVATIAAQTRAARVTTLTGVSAYVFGGLAVGMRLQADRPRLLINLEAARLEGADFSAELLRLAQVVP